MGKTRSGYRQMSRSEGLSHIENYYRSGLSPSQYYKQHGLSECQFYGWRRRYLALHPEAESAANVKKRFHPVRIESTAGIGLSGLEVHYPNGVRVVIGKDDSTDIEKLSALIKILVSCLD
jgi:hypothetical protein